MTGTRSPRDIAGEALWQRKWDELDAITREATGHDEFSTAHVKWDSVLEDTKESWRKAAEEVAE